MGPRDAAAPHWKHRWQLATYQVSQWSPGIAVGVIVVALLVGIGWIPWVARRDLDGTVPRQLEGRITDVYYFPVDNRSAPALATFAVDGRGFKANQWPAPFTGVPPLPVRLGDAVRVTYRIGRSGKEYVDRIDPVHTSPAAF
jgi:hypothetical protein